MARATASVPLTRLSSTNPPACPAHPDARAGASQAPLPARSPIGHSVPESSLAAPL